MKKGIKSSLVKKNLYKTPTCEELEPNLQTCEMLVQNYQRYEEPVLTVTDRNDKTEELESNAKYIRVWGYSINVRNTHVCYIKFDFVRTFHKVKDIGTEYVAYWYQFFTCR